MRVLGIILLAITIASCQSNVSEESGHSQEQHASEDSVTGAHHENANHHHGGHHGEANEHMHQSSVSDLIAHFDSPERDAYQKPDEVIKYLGDLNGKKIIDIGAGSGYFTFRLAEAGAQVIAGDVNDEFLDHIKKEIDRRDLEHLGIEVRKLPYDRPNLAGGEVDMVLLVNTYHHIQDRVEYFKKVLHGLAPGGELVIIDYYKKELPVGPPPDHKIANEQVVAELKAAGFFRFRFEEALLPYQFIIRATP